MKNFLKTTILMGILLSGFVFSSQTTMAAPVTFTIENHSMYPNPSYDGFRVAKDVRGITIDDYSDHGFTVNCSDALFSGTVNVSYSMFTVDVTFVNGQFSYATTTSMNPDVDVFLSGTTITMSNKPRPTESTFTIRNQSVHSFTFERFDSYYGVELVSRPERIPAGTGESFTIRHTGQRDCMISYRSADCVINMTVNGWSLACTSTSPLVIVTSDYNTITITDAPLSETFTVVNNTGIDFRFAGFTNYSSAELVGRQDVSRGESRPFTVTYPRSTTSAVMFGLSFTGPDSILTLNASISGGVIRCTPVILTPAPIQVVVSEDGRTITISPRT